MNEKEIREKVWALLQTGMYEKALKGKQIAVIGAGGAGGNIVEYLARNGLKKMEGVESMVINSDEEMLENCTEVDKKIIIGKNIDPHPKGAGGSRRIAKQMVASAKESLEVLIGPYPVIIVIAGLGGGTGSELIVELAKMGVAAGKFTMTIPVLPFSVESSRRSVARNVLRELKKTGAAVVEMDNDILLKPQLMGLPIEVGFSILNNAMLKSISEMHEATRKALIKEIALDIMAQLPPELESSPGIPMAEETMVNVQVMSGPEMIAAANPEINLEPMDNMDMGGMDGMDAPPEKQDGDGNPPLS